MVKITGWGEKTNRKTLLQIWGKKQKNEKTKISFTIVGWPKNAHNTIVLVADIVPVNWRTAVHLFCVTTDNLFVYVCVWTVLRLAPDAHEMSPNYS
jgi:hypothetical protein